MESNQISFTVRPARSIVWTFKRLLCFAGLLLIVGCSTYRVPALSVQETSPSLTIEERTALADLTPPVPVGPFAPIDVPSVPDDFYYLTAGDVLAGGIRVTEDLVAFERAKLGVDTDEALALLDRYAAQLSEEELHARFMVAERRATLLLISARPHEAAAVLPEMERLEIALQGSNINSLSVRGHLALWANDLDSAITHYSRVMLAIGAWQLPTSYLTAPTNIEQMLYVAFSQTRALLGLSVAYLFKGDLDRALGWSNRFHQSFRDIIGIFEHPIYGMFAKPSAEAFFGYTWALTTLAAAQTAHGGDLAANDHYFDMAMELAEAAGFADGPLVADCMRELAAYRGGVAQLPTARIGVLPEPDLWLDNESTSKPPPPSRQLRSWFGLPDRIGDPLEPSPAAVTLVEQRFADAVAGQNRTLAVPEAGSIKAPAAGDRHAYGFIVTPAMATASELYLAGRADAALAAIDIAEQERGTGSETAAQKAMMSFELAFLRAQILIMAGRAADAEETLPEIEARETKAFGSTINSRALRGEIRLWLGDTDGALEDMVQVANALGDWQMPTYAVCPPADVPQVVTLVRAQLRAYLGIVLTHLRRGDYTATAAWVDRAEELFRDVFFMVSHPAYGAYAELHPDMYYGRGLLRGALGAAQTVLEDDPALGTKAFEDARAYFDALGFTTGSAIIDGFRVRALLEIDRHDLAAPIAQQAAEDAAKRGLADLVWQLEAMAGETFIALNRADEAESAFRRAQAAITIVSGSLGTDQSKRRFSLGKGDVTQRLAALSVARRDWEQLFSDMETGRARAFVDMIGRRPVASDRERDLVTKIRALDRRLLDRRLRRSTFSARSQASDDQKDSDILEERTIIVRELARRDPDLADALSIRTTSLKQIRRRLKPGEMLAYALPARADERVRFLLTTRAETRLLETEITHSDVRKAVTAFDPVAHLAGTAREAAAAENVAIEVLTDGLKLEAFGEARLIHLVPTGSLYGVPWGALDTAGPVIVLPTGGWLNRSTSGRRRATAAVIGDPALGSEWDALPGARAEAKIVADFYDETPIIGENATEAMVRARVGDGVRMLHLATHAEFVSSAPLESALMLSGPSGTDRLTAERLFERPISAEIVVLSACDTGRGQVTVDDDFLGLARSFYIGGSRAVLNSLWPVHDAPTALFMEVFHRHALTGDLVGGWQAARDTLRAQEYPPSIFGAFVLGGAARL